MTTVEQAWHDYTEQLKASTPTGAVVFLAVHAGGDEPRLPEVIELGMALLLDKPLLLVVARGRQVPDGLRRAAAMTVEDWDPADIASTKRLEAALMTMAGGM